MPEDHEVLEAKLEQLAGELEELSRRLDYLYSYLRITGQEAGGSERPGKISGSAQGGMLGWAAGSSLLPGVSTVCFLLAVALILRTLTDNNLLDTKVGSFIGMGYAGGLMLVGYWRYEKQGRLGSVFLICGAVLICSVLVESYRRFNSLPALGAYLVLLSVGLAASFTGLRFQKGLPAALGVLGMCAASAALQYPDPLFPALAGILLVAGILGFLLRGLRGSSWIRWAVILITVLVMTYWSGRLTIALGRQDQELLVLLAPSWFLPVVGCFSILYPALCLLGVMGQKGQVTPRFEALVPGLMGLWAFGTVYQVLDSWGHSAELLGVAGALMGAAYLSAAHWLGRRAEGCGRGTNAFASGAGLLMGVSLPLVTGSGFFALPFLSGIALGLFVFSGIWKSGGVRLSSYLLQMYCSTLTAFFLWGEATAAHLATQVVLGGFVSLAGILHYGWCLKHIPPNDSSVFFSRYDRQDRTKILTLAGAIISGFFVLRAAMKEALRLLPGDFQNSFLGSQSILVNLFAAALMSYAYFRLDQAARNLAIVLTLIGGVKVFMFDLLQARGVPLVLSVLSFGLAVLLESILLGRWQKGPEVLGRRWFSRAQDSKS